MDIGVKDEGEDMMMSKRNVLFMYVLVSDESE